MIKILKKTIKLNKTGNFHTSQKGGKWNMKKCKRWQRKNKNTKKIVKTTKQNATFNPKYISNYIKLNWTKSSS